MILGGPRLWSLEFQDFKEQCPVLSSLDIPVVFYAPPEIYSEDNFHTSLMQQAGNIEKLVLEEYGKQTDQDQFLFSKGLLISMQVTTKTDGQKVIDLDYDMPIIVAKSGHLPQFEAADGYFYYNISKMIKKNKGH